jgi:hypothetical protein
MHHARYHARLITQSASVTQLPSPDFFGAALARTSATLVEYLESLPWRNVMRLIGCGMYEILLSFGRPTAQ